MPHHSTLFLLSALPVLEVWRMAQYCGYSLHWNPARRCVVLRPIREGAP
jgi:hypothetical protein